MKDLWVAEYSFNQKCFHHDTLERALEMNKRNVARKTPNDYVIFFIGSEEESSKEIIKMQDSFKV